GADRDAARSRRRVVRVAARDDIVIRRAVATDGAALGRLGATLMRLHHAWDPDRFLEPGASPEVGYGRFLASQIASEENVVFVAARGGEVVGYVFAGIEPRSWKELRDVAGFVHDVIVTDDARRQGIGMRLIETAAEWLTARGMQRVMLWTAEKNQAGQQL